MTARSNEHGVRVTIALDVREPSLRARVVQAVECGGRHDFAVAPAHGDVMISDAMAAADEMAANIAPISPPSTFAPPASVLPMNAPIVFIGSASRIADAMQRGVAGGLLTTFTPAQLAIAVDAVANGLCCVPAAAAAPNEKSRSRVAASDLTPRETEVLQLLVTGASNKQIARELEISVHTVKFHVAAVVAKLGASGRTDAVAKAMRERVLML